MERAKIMFLTETEEDDGGFSVSLEIMELRTLAVLGVGFSQRK